MSSTCFEPEGSSSERRLYVQVRYNLFTCNSINSLVGGRVCTFFSFMLYDYTTVQLQKKHKTVHHNLNRGSIKLIRNIPASTGKATATTIISENW